VDFTRACYSVDMRFFRDDPSRRTRVQWYYTASTKSLPFAIAFYRREWERHTEPQEPIGEIYGTERWHGPDPPYTIGYGGFCGTAEQWGIGALTSDPVPAKYAGQWVPVCCPEPPPSPRAGVGVGAIVDPCCLGQNTAPLFFTWDGSPCIPGGGGSVPLMPFSGNCGLDPASVTACLYVTPVFVFMGLTCQLVFCCDPTIGAFGQPGWILVGTPGNPCVPLVPPPSPLIYGLVLACNPFRMIAQSLFEMPVGPCAGYALLFNVGP